MDVLDLRTIVLSHLATTVMCMVVFAFLWRQYRKRYAGLSFWLADYALQLLAALLIGLRGQIPDWTSMVVANTLIMLGALLGYLGLERFVGRRSRQWHNVALLVGFVLVHSYFCLVQPSLTARNLNIATGLLLIGLQCAWLMLRRVESGLRPMTRGVGLIFAALCLLNVARIAHLVADPPATDDYFKSGLVEAAVMLLYQLLFILLTFGMVLMVNRRLQFELQCQEEKYAKAFHSSPYAITLTRLSNGELVEVNPGFQNITGYQQTEVVGKTTLDLQLWPKSEDRIAVVNTLLHGKPVQDKECVFRKKSGELGTGQLSAQIISIQDEKWILSSFQDITERKRFEAERAAFEAQMRHQQKLESIGTLAAGVAHEINNPINGVMNYAQLIMDESPRDAQVTEYAREIVHGTERVATIVRNLLQFSRQEKQAHSPARLQDVIAQTLSLIQTVLKRDQITMQTDLPPDLPTINCRSQQLQQVLMNLLTNARDALNQKYPGYDANKQIILSARMIADGAAPDSAIEDSAARLMDPGSRFTNHAIRITVEDHGAGIPEPVQARIFEPFFSTKSRHEGTGLGLSISHGIVKEHHGRLWFETTPGEGSKFHVELPVEPEEIA